jgi:hypothetical protein
LLPRPRESPPLLLDDASESLSESDEALLSLLSLSLLTFEAARLRLAGGGPPAPALLRPFRCTGASLSLLSLLLSEPELSESLLLSDAARLRAAPDRVEAAGAALPAADDPDSLAKRALKSCTAPRSDSLPVASRSAPNAARRPNELRG